MSDIDNVVLEKDAFDNDTTVVDAMVPEAEPFVDHRGDLVEIGSHFDNVQMDEALVHIAKTNQLDISWEKLQRLLDSLINKQCTIMEDKIKDEETKKAVDVISTRIIHSINEHSNCPFTIQRLCELLIEPKKYYKMYIKYLRAVDKVLSVTSYWEDYVNTTPNKDEDNKIEVPLLLPSFSVELEPHHFDTEDNGMEDVTKDGQVKEMEQDIPKEEEKVAMEEVIKEDVTKEENVAKEEEEEKSSEPTKEENHTTTTTTTTASTSPPPSSDGKMDLD